MNTLRIIVVGVLFAAATAAVGAAEEPSVLTITSKPPHATAPTVERVPPRGAVDIAVLLPTDMPEAEIDHHLPLLDTPRAPAAERVTS